MAAELHVRKEHILFKKKNIWTIVEVDNFNIVRYGWLICYLYIFACN